MSALRDQTVVNIREPAGGRKQTCDGPPIKKMILCSEKGGNHGRSRQENET